MSGRKLISLLLALCLGAPIAITYLNGSMMRAQHKKQIKRHILAGINRSELIPLHFEHNEANKVLKWKNDHEFEYQNKMYDVVEQHANNTDVFFWCILDHGETALNKKIDALMSKALQGQRPHSDQNEKLIDFFKSLFYTKASENLSINLSYKKPEYPIYHLEILDVYKHTANPPPRV